MKPADLLHRARQGDAQAIALLLQRSLVSQHITVSATQAQGCLEIILDGEGVPDQTVMIETIRRGLRRLRVTHLEVVRVHAMQPGFDWFAWSEEVEMGGRSRPGDEARPPLDAPEANAPEASGVSVPSRGSQRPHQRPGRYGDRPTPRQPGSQSASRPNHRPSHPAVKSPSGPSLPAQRQGEVFRGRPTSSPPRRTSRQRDLGLLFLETFNPFKVALVVVLTLHTVFGSPHYTIQGFLAGSDFLMMFLHGVNLIFHEAGHVFFAIFGRFIMILGGSLFQIMVPACLCGYFWLTRQRFTSAIAFWWTGQNFLDVSIYVRDARERDLPLIGGLDETAHDWHNILLHLHLLQWDDLIANHVYGIGILIYLVALGLAIFYARRSWEKLSAGYPNPSG